MRSHEFEPMGAWLLVNEVIDVTLAIDRDLPGLVPRDWRVAHQLEQRMQLAGIGVGIFDEFEAVGAHRVVGRNRGGRRVMRKRTHLVLPDLMRTYVA